MKGSKSIIGSVCLVQIIMIIGSILTASATCFGQVDRETWQPPEQIMDSIGVMQGMRVGEAGAGQGHSCHGIISVSSKSQRAQV